MASARENPVRGVGAPAGFGTEKPCVVAGFDLEITSPLLARQAEWLAARLGLSLERAKLIAGLAFDQRGRL
jgi:hypothetical protein